MQPTNCRKCFRDNPTVYLAPYVDQRDENENPAHLSVICLDCCEKRGWIDPRTGNIVAGVEL